MFNFLGTINLLHVLCYPYQAHLVIMPYFSLFAISFYLNGANVNVNVSLPAWSTTANHNMDIHLWED